MGPLKHISGQYYSLNGFIIDIVPSNNEANHKGNDVDKDISGEELDDTN